MGQYQSKNRHTKKLPPNNQQHEKATYKAGGIIQLSHALERIKIQNSIRNSHNVRAENETPREQK